MVVDSASFTNVACAVLFYAALCIVNGRLVICNICVFLKKCGYWLS